MEKDNNKKVYVRDTMARKYQITVNNPLKAIPPFTHERIKEEIGRLKSVIYFCLCDEIGTEGTFHTHIFLMTGGTPIRFSTVQNRFQSEDKPYAHIESAYGSADINRMYLLKEGKFKESKGETSVEGSFEEYGEIPHSERMSKNGELQFIVDMVDSGYTTAEILRIHPEVLPYLEKIDKARQILLEEKYKDTFRKMETIYVFGKTNTGKTRTIMESAGEYSRVYRVVDYALHRMWDRYFNQEIVCFEEFHSSIPIQMMLIFLDGYPVDLPARYNQKTACFIKCYITSNIPLEKQYENIQRESPETWKAFLRRIHKVIHYEDNGKITEYSTQEYLERNNKFHAVEESQEKIPFD